MCSDWTAVFSQSREQYRAWGLVANIAAQWHPVDLLSLVHFALLVTKTSRDRPQLSERRARNLGTFVIAHTSTTGPYGNVNAA